MWRQQYSHYLKEMNLIKLLLSFCLLSQLYDIDRSLSHHSAHLSLGYKLCFPEQQQITTLYSCYSLFLLVNEATLLAVACGYYLF